LDCLNFAAWYFNTQSFYSRIELVLKNNNQKYSELSYEQIHSHSSNDEKVDFLLSWLNDNGIEVKQKPEVVNHTKKQDRRKQSLAKINNAEEVQKYFTDNNLGHLIYN